MQVEGLARVLAQMLVDPDHLRRMGENASGLAAERFALAPVVDALEALYAEVAAAHRARPDAGNRARDLGRGWRRLLLVAVAGHLAFGLLRLPHAAWSKRLGKIEELRGRGATEFQLASASSASRAAVSWLQTHTPPDAVILWRGEFRGIAELAPALLWPRLVYREEAVVTGADTVHGRPIARGRLAGREATVVLVSSATELRLEPR
jgi:hypothetical protein